MEINYEKQAINALLKMPSNISARIRRKIEQYADDPDSLAQNVIRLQGEDGYRLRVGDWRIIFDIEGDTIIIEGIRPRSGAYKG